MSELDWRPPGSDRVQATPFWSPGGGSSVAEPDPFRTSPADRDRRPPGQIPLTLEALGLGARPGIVPLRPLGLGDVMGGVIRAIRGNVGSTMGLAAITNVVFLVPMTALAAWTGSLTTTVDSAPQVQMLAQYLPAVGTWLSSILLTGFMAYVIGQGVRGRRVTPYETFTQTMRRIGALLLATLLVVGTSAVLVAGAGVAIFVMISGTNRLLDVRDGRQSPRRAPRRSGPSWSWPSRCRPSSRSRPRRWCWNASRRCVPSRGPGASSDRPRGPGSGGSSASAC